VLGQIRLDIAGDQLADVGHQSPTRRLDEGSNGMSS
jgi:hypothetical protein